MSISTAYDFTKSQYASIPPLTGTFNFTFDDAGVPRSCIPPSYCPNQTVFPAGISATSTLSALVPSGFPNGVGFPAVYYAPDFSNSSYVGVFDWSNPGTTIYDAASGEYLTHAIYVAVLKLASNSFTYGTVTEFLLGALDDPSAFQVIAGEVWYSSPLDPANGAFTQGWDWRDYNAVLASVNDQRRGTSPFSIPEPNTLLLILAATLGIIGIGSRKSSERLAA